MGLAALYTLRRLSPITTVVNPAPLGFSPVFLVYVSTYHLHVVFPSLLREFLSYQSADHVKAASVGVVYAQWTIVPLIARLPFQIPQASPSPVETTIYRERARFKTNLSPYRRRFGSLAEALHHPWHRDMAVCILTQCRHCQGTRVNRSNILGTTELDWGKGLEIVTVRFCYVAYIRATSSASKHVGKCYSVSK